MDFIMMVCVGNICRSPLAEALMRKKLPEKTIYSSGLGALIGHQAHENSKKFAEDENCDLNKHRAQQINSNLCRKSDLILVMEEKHKQHLEKIYPFTKGKIKLLGLDKKGKKIEIEDPYKKENDFFLECNNKIKESVENWAEIIKKL